MNIFRFLLFLIFLLILNISKICCMNLRLNLLLILAMIYCDNRRRFNLWLSDGSLSFLFLVSNIILYIDSLFIFQLFWRKSRLLLLFNSMLLHLLLTLVFFIRRNLIFNLFFQILIFIFFLNYSRFLYKRNLLMLFMSFILIKSFLLLFMILCLHLLIILLFSMN